MPQDLRIQGYMIRWRRTEDLRGHDIADVSPVDAIEHSHGNLPLPGLLFGDLELPGSLDLLERFVVARAAQRLEQGLELLGVEFLLGALVEQFRLLGLDQVGIDAAALDARFPGRAFPRMRSRRSRPGVSGCGRCRPPRRRPCAGYRESP